MPTHNAKLTEHQRQEQDKARIEWLRSTAREGFDAVSRGDYAAVNSEAELDSLLDGIYEEVSAGLATERQRG